MSIEQALAVELQCRTQVLPKEVDRWKALTEGNVDGSGIHRSQMVAVREMLDTLLKRQRAAVDKLNEQVDKPGFAKARMKLERELSGGHGIMAIFQHILAQRQQDLPYRDALDAADLMVAECYTRCLQSARGWGVLDADDRSVRPPPLTHLNAALSPTAFTRRHQLGLFGLPGEGIRELKLPISVLSLPFDHTAALWTYCTLYHEIGHPLDQDLKLFEALEAPVQQAVDAARRDRWLQWLREMVADAFGVTLGGAAYALSLAGLLVRPTTDMTKIEPTDTHPNAYVRGFLVAEMLRRFAAQVPDMGSTATDIEALWRSRYQATDELSSYVAECRDVVNALFDTKLDALQGHKLSEFGDGLASDHDTMQKLASWLQTGVNRPDPKRFPVRLVPGAAQLALAAAVPPQAATYAGIHVRAMDFIKAIPRPQFLAGAGVSEARKQFYRELTEKISFDPEDEEPEDGT